MRGGHADGRRRPASERVGIEAMRRWSLPTRRIVAAGAPPAKQR